MGCVTTKSAATNHVTGCSTESIPTAAAEAELPKHFDAKEYAVLIFEAMAKGKEDLVIKALQESTTAQRTEIQEEYRDKFSSDLYHDSQDKMSKKYAYVAAMLLKDRYHMIARQLETSFRKSPSDDITAAEIVCSYDYEVLRKVTKEYETTVVGISLDQEIAENCSPGMVEILRARLTLETGEQPDPGPDQDARDMVSALTTNNLFEGNRLFQECLKTKCLTDVMWTLEYFLQKCQRDMTVEIEKHYDDDPVRNNYVALAKLFRNRSLYVATKIHERMASEEDEQQMELVYLILIQDEESLKGIKNSYRTTFFEPLSRDIKDEVKDPIIRRVLLRAVK